MSNLDIQQSGDFLARPDVIRENHVMAVPLHTMYINFARPMKVLANPHPRTPAMAAGLKLRHYRRDRRRCDREASVNLEGSGF